MAEDREVTPEGTVTLTTTLVVCGEAMVPGAILLEREAAMEAPLPEVAFADASIVTGILLVTSTVNLQDEMLMPYLSANSTRL